VRSVLLCWFIRLNNSHADKHTIFFLGITDCIIHSIGGVSELLPLHVFISCMLLLSRRPAVQPIYRGRRKSSVKNRSIHSYVDEHSQKLELDSTENPKQLFKPYVDKSSYKIMLHSFEYA
jgi:hypothetical protein